MRDLGTLIVLLALLLFGFALGVPVGVCWMTPAGITFDCWAQGGPR